MRKKIVTAFHFTVGFIFTVVFFGAVVAVILYESGWMEKNLPHLYCIINHQPRILVDNNKDSIRVIHMKSDCSCDTITYVRQ